MVKAVTNCLDIAKMVVLRGHRNSFSTTRFLPYVEKWSSREAVIGQEKVAKIKSSYERLQKQIATMRDFLWGDWHKKTDSQIARDFIKSTETCKQGIHLRNKYGTIPMINCAEEAVRTKIALEAKGIKNANVANIYLPDNTTHAVCIFNRDGSQTYGNIINNQTVIVDSWLGKSDMANQMLMEYKKLFNLPQKEPIYLWPQDTIKLTEAELNQLKKEFPELLN